MANLYAVLITGSVNFGDSTTWSTTANGLGVPHAAPTGADNAYISSICPAGATLVFDVSPSCAIIDLSSAANTPTINLSASVVTCTSWTCGTLTLTCGTSTINCSGNFSGNGKTYNVVNLTGATSTIAGSNTFASLALPNGTTQTITFTDTTTQTITTPVLSGSLGHVHTLQGSASGGWTLTKANGGDVPNDYISISRCTGNPVTTWRATNSTDGLNNVNWLFITSSLVERKMFALGMI